MKKLFVAFIVASVAFAGLNAQQSGETFVPLNYNSVKKKVEKSNADIQDPKKSLKASTWQKRGELYQDVFEVGLEQITEDMPISSLTLFYKEPTSIETETKDDGSLHEKYIYPNMIYNFVNGAFQDYERVNPISEDPLRTSMDAYYKALELDEKGKISPKVKENFVALKAQLKVEGVNNYYTSKYEEALHSFENVLEVNKHELFAGEFDTVMVQFSGIISREIAAKTDDKELYKKAIAYYEELAEVGFGGPNTWLQIKMDYISITDTLGALQVMQDAYAKYPDTINIIANLADIYVQLKLYDEGIEKMEEVIAANPSIPESYYWQGRLLIYKEENEFIERAIEAYKKVSELDPTIYYSWYDLGYIYYLQGQDYYDRANSEEHDATREELLKLGKEKYGEAIPVLEKAYELNDENPNVKVETLDLLQRIYYKEQMMDQYERVKEPKNTI